MAYYGAGVVVSLGLDSGDVPFDMRDEAVPGRVRRGAGSPPPSLGGRRSPSGDIDHDSDNVSVHDPERIRVQISWPY